MTGSDSLYDDFKMMIEDEDCIYISNIACMFYEMVHAYYVEFFYPHVTGSIYMPRVLKQ